jgi:hypothetical protein
MDRPPLDSGSDRYDYVELIDAPLGVEPVGAWFDQLLREACKDCRANIFLLWQGASPAMRGYPNSWHITIAHDETCPWLEAAESGK